MVIFEKYIDNELNIFSSIYFKLKLKNNESFRRKYEQYKNMSNNLKQMFIINEAEKEMEKDSNLKKISSLVDTYLNRKHKDENIIYYLDNAFF